MERKPLTESETKFEARLAKAAMDLERYRNIYRKMLKNPKTHDAYQEQLRNVGVAFARCRVTVTAMNEMKTLMKEDTNE